MGIGAKLRLTKRDLKYFGASYGKEVNNDEVINI